MDVKAILARIDRRLEKIGKAQDAVSREAGAPDAIRNMRKPGRKNVETRTLLKLAPKLGTTFMWLLDEIGPEEAEDALAGLATPVPLLSMVQAGDIKRPEHVDKFEDAPMVSAPGIDPKGDWIALRVEGDSMDRISPPGSVIFVNLRDKKLVPNACYVIADEDGGASYKRFRPDPPRWEPVSENRAHEPFFVKGGRHPRIVGRVRKTVLDL